MKIIRTKEEFKRNKEEFIDKLDVFMFDYGEFMKGVSPKFWRSIGRYHSNLKNLKDDINSKIYPIEPIEMKHLKSDIVRKEVLTDEEEELWNAQNKYNL